MEKNASKNKSQVHEIRDAINGFSAAEIQKFIWLCAVRTVPYIGDGRQFNYWTENKQSHLLGVLRTIDYCAVCVTDSLSDIKGITAAVARAADTIYTTYSTHAINALAACAAAAHAAHDANKTDQADDSADFTARAVAFVRSAVNNVAMAAFNPNPGNYNGKDILDIFLDDIEIIRTGQLDKRNNDTSVYGEVWTNFLEDLKEAGCGYWADIYTDLFEKKVIMDENDIQSLHRRLNVPLEIQEQGAAEVGRYMLALANGAEL